MGGIPTIFGVPINQGEFQRSDKPYCYPLTVTDYCSLYLVLCEALESDRESLAFSALERLFQERGLPRSIPSDNGVRFASPHGLFQLFNAGPAPPEQGCISFGEVGRIMANHNKVGPRT